MATVYEDPAELLMGFFRTIHPQQASHAMMMGHCYDTGELSDESDAVERTILAEFAAGERLRQRGAVLKWIGYLDYHYSREVTLTTADMLSLIKRMEANGSNPSNLRDIAERQDDVNASFEQAKGIWHDLRRKGLSWSAIHSAFLRQPIRTVD